MNPKVREPRHGAFELTTAPAIVVGSSLVADHSRAYQPLQDFLVKRFGAAVTVLVASSLLPDAPFILLGRPTDHELLRTALSNSFQSGPSVEAPRDGYVIDVSPHSIVIASDSVAGVSYGLKELLECEIGVQGSMAVPAGRIVDWPTMERRGIHFLLKSRLDMPHLETVITQHMPTLRLNCIVIEVNYRFEFDSHPEMREGDPKTKGQPLCKEDCARLVELASQQGITVIPMLNCLGHQSWEDYTARLLTAHPEFDETPGLPADNKEIYCRSWCPCHPDINAFIFDLIDEIVDAFQATAFHVGMDEVFVLGRCPRCRGIDNARLFAKSVNDIYAHVVDERKLEMLIWGDRLLDGKLTNYGEWEASANDTAPAIDLIPKDIIICDWHYENTYAGERATYPSIRLFQDKGFKVWPAGWRSGENARLLIEAAHIKPNDRIAGYMATTWIEIPAVNGGLSGDNARLAEPNVAGVTEAIRVGAQLAWEGLPRVGD